MKAAVAARERVPPRPRRRQARGPGQGVGIARRQGLLLEPSRAEVREQARFDRVVRGLKRRGVVKIGRSELAKDLPRLRHALNQHFPDQKFAYSDQRKEFYVVSKERPGTPVEIQRGGGFFNVPALAADFRDVAVESAVGIPALGQSLYHDPVGTLKAMPGAMVSTLAKDLSNPWEHPGRALIAAASLGAIGVGGATRTASAGRAFSQTRSVRSALTRKSAEGGSLLRRPLPGVQTVTYKGEHGVIAVDVPLSKNPIMRSHQKFRLHRIQKQLDEGHVPERLPAMGKWARENLSAQAKLGRERRAQRRPLVDIALAPAYEAEPALSWVSKRTIKGSRRGYRIDPVRNTALAIVGIFGEEAFNAPAATVRQYADFYRQQARWLEGAPSRDAKRMLEAAEREIIAAEGAQRYLENRTPELLAAVDAARRLSALAEGELLDLGLLTPERAAGRIAKAEEVFTGQRRYEEAQRSRTMPEADARVAELEEWVGRRVDFVAETFLGDPDKRLEYGTGRDKDTRRRRVQHPGKTYGIGEGDYLDEPPKVLPIKHGTMREQALADAEAQLYRRGKLENADPMLREIAEKMDELEELKKATTGRRAADLFPEEANLPLGDVTERGAALAPSGAFFFTMAAQVRNAIRQRAPTPSEARVSEYGVAPPSAGIPGLRKGFTGESFTEGPTDVAVAVQDRFLRVTRFRGLLDTFDELWEAGSDVRRSEWDIPLRSSKTIRDDLRKIVKDAFQEWELNPNLPEFERGILSAEKLAALKELLTRTGDAAEGVRWIDRRFAKDILGVTAPYKSMPIFDAINNIIRIPVLFLRPAYALNALGNTAMGFITQGPLAPRNFWLGAKAKQVYGPSLTAKIDAAVGESRTLSYTVHTGTAARASRKLAKGWSRLVDLWFRRSAFLHNARKMGFEGKEGIARLFAEEKRALVEVSRRSRKDAVDFDSLTPVERNTLKHIVFFYPWVSRGSAWAVRAGVEHPLFALSALELSERGERYLEQNFPDGRPSWTKLSTLSPFGGDRAQVFGSVWTPSTAAQLGSLFAGNEEVSDVLTPAAKLVEAALGGNLPDAGTAGLELLENLPQVGATRRMMGESTSKTFPGSGLAEGLGPFVAGGLYPRTVDKSQLERQAAREKPDPEKAVYNTRQSRAALKGDIERLGYEEPESVRKAWRLQEQFDREVAKHDSYRAKLKGTLRLARRLELVSPYVLRTYLKRADEMTEDMNELYLGRLGDAAFGGRVLTAARSVVNERLRAKGLEPAEAELIAR